MDVAAWVAAWVATVTIAEEVGAVVALLGVKVAAGAATEVVDGMVVPEVTLDGVGVPEESSAAASSSPYNERSARSSGAEN